MTPVLVGRDHHAELLRAQFARARESHGGLVLVTGEAGIGKTALVTGLADEAARTGALVLHGTCWDSDNAPGYWPWVQVLRGLRRGIDAHEWADVERLVGNTLPVLLGEARQPEDANDFALYDAVTTALVSVSARRPVLVVLDDLHWSDAASLRLLEFAARHTWFERLLLVGTYRDVEVDRAGHPLQPLITPLVALSTTVTLTGLDPHGVAAVMARITGVDPDAELVAEVHRRTGGNPFFVEQAARLWHSGGSLTALTPGVRDVLQRRLAQLSAPVRELLTTAAVLGRQFHRPVLAAAVAAPAPQVERQLEQAVAARLVAAQGAGRFGFAHDLVRESLYEGLDEKRLRQRHADVVRAVDDDPALTDRVLPAELAGHAYHAGDELPPSRVVDHLLAAARDAGGRMAFEESIEHLRRALERIGEHDPRRRVAITLDLAGDLDHADNRADNRAEALALYEQAAAIARELADAALLARVALSVYRIDRPPRRFEDGVLREAYQLLTGEPPARDTRSDRLVLDLTVRLAEQARQDEDDDALKFGLWMRHNSLWGPGSAADREALTAELVALARRLGDRMTEAFAASFRWVALLEQGDERYLEQFHDFLAAAERGGRPSSAMASAVDQSVIAVLAGRFAESESHMDQAIVAVGEAAHPHFSFMMQHLRWACWLQQGRFDELAELHRELTEQDHPFPVLLEALTAAQRKDHAALAALMPRLLSAEPYPRDFLSLWLRLQAQAAAVLGDSGLARRARTGLEPYRGQWLVALYGCDIGGPVDLWLAVLDLVDGRWDEAITGFTEAYRSADRMQARPFAVQARAGLAKALTARGAAGDAERARSLRDEVEQGASALGIRHLAEVVGNAVPAASSPGTSRSGEPDQAAPVPPRPHEFRRDGAVWSLRYAGRVAHLPDAKGLRDLHLLLSRPGTDVPAVRLLNPSGGDVVVAARRLGGDPLLDDEAKARYKQHIERLDDEIDRVAQLGDDRRAAELDTERQALLDQLRSAAGLAGRSRRLGDEAERARKTVTARIRDVLRKLDRVHPDLAEHLRACVTTGANCAYRPEADVSWRL